MNIRLLPALLLLMFTTCGDVWSAPLTVYVAEFGVSGSNNSKEVKAIVQTLLLSRLAGEKIATVSKPEGADVKISGSYLLSGTIFSLDAVAVNNTGAVIVRAYTQGKNPDELIPSVTSLAKSLNDGIVKALLASGTPQASARPVDIIIPPRKIPASIQQQSVLKMDGALIGLSVGRTFPDGDRELFVIGNHVFRYYRQGTALKLLAEIHYKVYENILAVDTVVHENSKTPEIYLTIMDGEKLVSQVWTVDGASLKQVAGPLPYYFRTVTGIDGAKKLYAQQISDKDDFYGPVAEPVRLGENYQLTNQLRIPKLGELYNFAIVKGNRGESDYAVIDHSSHLRFFNPAGDEIWKSSEKFGGSETHFTRAEAISQKDSFGEAVRNVFLDQRIVVKANGELFIPRNYEPWYMLNKHYYTRSSLYCLAWNGMDIEEKWHTSEVDNYLADFAYDDAAHELILLEVISKSEGVFASGASRLVIMKIK